jgi:hypothetical protein
MPQDANGIYKFCERRREIMQHAHSREPEPPQATPSSVALAIFPDVQRAVLLASISYGVSRSRVAAELARLLDEV